MPPAAALDLLEVVAHQAEFLESPSQALGFGTRAAENPAQQNVLDQGFVTAARFFAQGRADPGPLPAKVRFDSAGQHPPPLPPAPCFGIRTSFAGDHQESDDPRDHANRRGDYEQRLIQLKT